MILLAAMTFELGRNTLRTRQKVEELQREFGRSILFLTHDLGVVAEMADDVVVMRHGRVVERGSRDDIFLAPRHPYTRELLSLVPRLDAPAPVYAWEGAS